MSIAAKAQDNLNKIAYNLKEFVNNEHRLTENERKELSMSLASEEIKLLLGKKIVGTTTITDMKTGSVTLHNPHIGARHPDDWIPVCGQEGGQGPVGDPGPPGPPGIDRHVISDNPCNVTATQIGYIDHHTIGNHSHPIDSDTVWARIKAGNAEGAMEMINSFLSQIDDRAVRDEINRKYINNITQGGNNMRTEGIVKLWAKRRINNLNTVYGEVRKEILGTDKYYSEMQDLVTQLNDIISIVNPGNKKMMTVESALGGYAMPLSEVLSELTRANTHELNKERDNFIDKVNDELGEIIVMIQGCETYDQEMMILNSRGILDGCHNIFIDECEFDNLRNIGTHP